MWLTGLVAPRHVGSSQTRARTRVPCISRQILNHCATREAPVALNLNLCTCSVIFDTCSLLFCASLFASVRLDAVLNPNFGHNLSESSIFFYFLRARTESLETELEDFQLYSKISLYDTCFVPRYHFSPIFFVIFSFSLFSLLPLVSTPMTI